MSSVASSTAPRGRSRSAESGLPLLALLAAGPAHGYELKQALEQRFGAVLPPLNSGQIYTTLARLQRDGLVEDDAVEQDGRPNKRVYRVTAAGRDELERWVAEPTSSCARASSPPSPARVAAASRRC